MSQNAKNYYLPGASFWPLIASVALFLMAAGFAMQLNAVANGTFILIAGTAVLAYLLFGWFAEVIKESVSGFYNKQVDASFRWSMGWFIFSEVMFFAGFFGALFYVRNFSLEWIEAGKYFPDFVAAWPTAGPAWPKGAAEFTTAITEIPAWGLPAINTLILLISGATLTWAHWGLMKNNRKQLIIGLILTIALGVTFLYLQAHEYAEATFTMADSGIFGSTFYMLTGFHGLHVTMGAIMLSIILFRVLKGHFDSHNHFGFEAVAWYWHFVDVVWLLLFVFVYWL
jgi:cytochrome c oxidase subunit III